MNVRCKEGIEVSLRLGPPLFLECYANVRVFLRDIKEPPLTYLSPKNKKKYGTGLTQRYSWYGGSRFNGLLALPFILMIYKHLYTQQPTFGGKLCTDISPQTLSDQRWEQCSRNTVSFEEQIKSKASLWAYFRAKWRFFRLLVHQSLFQWAGENFYKQLTVCCGGCSLSVFSGIMLWVMSLRIG